MIRFIKGIYAMNTENGIVVETPSGIGFEINLPQGSPLYRYAEGDEIMVYTAMIVKEDDMSLYGFNNRESLELFRLLTTVNGIGPKGAMSILGSMPAEQLKQAIYFGDVKEISKAQGVGKKTAERLVLELKDKIGSAGDEPAGKGIRLEDISGTDSGDSRTEAISALVSLGYSRQEAFGAVAKISDDTLTSEDYIKLALKNLF